MNASLYTVQDRGFESPCWIWRGGKQSAGYGMASRTQLAHRVSYEEAKGPIPAGLELDHLCSQKDCVNPDHLEAVTHRENVRRALRANRCHRGHPLVGGNLHVLPDGRWRCRICHAYRERTRQARRRSRTAANPLSL